jgi:prevent-host-death family protein
MTGLMIAWRAGGRGDVEADLPVRQECSARSVRTSGSAERGAGDLDRHVSHGGTPWHTRYSIGVVSQPEITQRDLRHRSKEIMDAVEGGQSFTVTRDGHEVGELIPLRRRRRFVPRDEFAAMSHNAATVDVDAFRADQAAVADHDVVDPYGR